MHGANHWSCASHVLCATRRAILLKRMCFGLYVDHVLYGDTWYDLCNLTASTLSSAAGTWSIEASPREGERIKVRRASLRMPVLY